MVLLKTRHEVMWHLTKYIVHDYDEISLSSSKHSTTCHGRFRKMPENGQQDVFFSLTEIIKDSMYTINVMARVEDIHASVVVRWNECFPRVKLPISSQKLDGIIQERRFNELGGVNLIGHLVLKADAGAQQAMYRRQDSQCREVMCPDVNHGYQCRLRANLVMKEFMHYAHNPEMLAELDRIAEKQEYAVKDKKKKFEIDEARLKQIRDSGYVPLGDKYPALWPPHTIPAPLDEDQELKQSTSSCRIMPLTVQDPRRFGEAIFVGTFRGNPFGRSYGGM